MVLSRLMVIHVAQCSDRANCIAEGACLPQRAADIRGGFRLHIASCHRLIEVLLNMLLWPVFANTHEGTTGLVGKQPVRDGREIVALHGVKQDIDSDA